MTIQSVGSKSWMGIVGTARLQPVGTPMRDVMRQDAMLPAAPETGEDEAEQRCAPRFTLLIRSAKLIAPDGEYLCVVRDASETGVSVRLFHPLPDEVPLSLELPNGDKHQLERVWEEPGKAGFRFTDAVDVERIVEAPSRFAKRSVRVNIEVPCTIMANLRWSNATILNLSQQGAMIATEERLSLLQRVKIKADGLPEIAAKVRWRRDEKYGLSFEDTFQFAELAAVAFDLQRKEA